MGDIGNSPVPGIDLDKIRLAQDFAGQVSVRRHVLRFPARRPAKTEFFRARREEQWLAEREAS